MAMPNSRSRLAVRQTPMATCSTTTKTRSRPSFVAWLDGACLQVSDYRQKQKADERKWRETSRKDQGSRGMFPARSLWSLSHQGRASEALAQVPHHRRVRWRSNQPYRARSAAGSIVVSCGWFHRRLVQQVHEERAAAHAAKQQEQRRKHALIRCRAVRRATT